MKQCKKCGETKPLSDFYAHPRMKDGHLNQCIVCRDAYVKEWSEKNRERRREISRQWATKDRAANPERHKEHFASYYQKLKASPNWPAVVAQKNKYRFHPKATPSWADEEKILSFFREAHRRTLETGEVWTVDHIVPLNSPIVCGLHTQDNLEVVTKSANSAKKNVRWPDMP